MINQISLRAMVQANNLRARFGKGAVQQRREDLPVRGDRRVEDPGDRKTAQPYRPHS